MNEMAAWTGDELDEVVDLLNAASPFDRFEATAVRAAVFDDPDYAPDLLVFIREAGAVVAAAAGVARRSRVDASAAPIGHVKLLAVAPAWQGRGLGSALLAELEGRLGRAGASTIRVFADAPMYLRPGVDFRLDAFRLLPAPPRLPLDPERRQYAG